MPNFRGTRFSDAHETPVWCARAKDARDTFNHEAMTALNDDLRMRRDWLLPIRTGEARLTRPDGRKAHPTRKPEALLWRVVLAASRVGDMVLDPSFGTGTTGAVPRQPGRRDIGIERDGAYADQAEARLAGVRRIDDTGLVETPRKRQQPRIPFGRLLERGHLRPGDVLYGPRRRDRARADGTLVAAEGRGSIHKTGAEVQGAPACNGRTFRHIGRKGRLVPIDMLRREPRAEPNRSRSTARVPVGHDGSAAPAAPSRSTPTSPTRGRMPTPGPEARPMSDGVYAPADTRYDTMRYNRCGRSGLRLPAISLGLWHNFGEDSRFDNAREICRTAFDCGITHFDLANNYGPPPGSAERTFGRILDLDFAAHRDELIIASKAGYRMWPGPYGEWGSRKYLLASLDRSLARMGLDHVDIFYSHRHDPETPLEETMGALASAVSQGKALYAGISSYNADCTRRAAGILRDLGTPCLIHQPSYSMINRWIEDDGLLDTLEDEGIGSIAFTPLAQGMLTGKYLGGIPADSRAAQDKSLDRRMLSEQNLARVRALNAVAERRGQSLAQMALAWVLRGGLVTSALIGASRPEQVRDSVRAIENLDFAVEELAEIDRYAVEGGVNLWAKSSAG